MKIKLIERRRFLFGGSNFEILLYFSEEPVNIWIVKFLTISGVNHTADWNLFEDVF